jgi:hypothetical protein
MEKHDSNTIGEKPVPGAPGFIATDDGVVVADQNQLHKNLKGRHMQMIAMYVLSARERDTRHSVENRADLFSVVVVPLALVSSSAQAVLSNLVAQVPSCLAS